MRVSREVGGIVLEKGVKISVSGERKELKDHTIAKGVVTHIREQRGMQFVYLDTGGVIIVFPRVSIDAEDRGQAINKTAEMALKRHGRRFKKWICRKEG